MSFGRRVSGMLRRDPDPSVSAHRQRGGDNGRRFTLVLAVGCLMALGGCGSSAQTSMSSTSSPASRTQAPTTAPVEEGSKAAWRLLDDAASALHSIHSYVMRGVLTQDERRVRFELRTSSSTSIEMTLSMDTSTAQIRLVPAGYYLRANAAFWRQHFGARAAAAAGHWLQVPSASARAFTSSLGSLAPSNLSRCILENRGALSIAGRTRIDGRPAIVIRDAGDVPGGSPSLFAIAANRPRFPLWSKATGPTRPGGPIDVCNDGKGSDIGGSVTISDYGRVPDIQAPRDVLRPGSIS
jgi:hypothetical protein